MQRKLSFTILIIVLICLGVWMLDRWSILTIWPVDPEDCLPADAAMVVSLPEMEQALGLTARPAENLWEQAVQQLPGLAEDVDLINSLIDTLFPSRSLIDRTHGLLCLNAIDDQLLGGTWILDLRNLGNLKPAEWLAAKKMDYQVSSFRGNPVWTVKLPGGRQLAAGTMRNLLILARLPYQVEAVLATDPHDPNWIKDLGKASGPARVSLYCNPSRLRDIESTLFTADGEELVQNWEEWFYSARIDFFAIDEGYRIGGEIVTSDKWLGTHIPPDSLKSDLWGLLPSNTASIKIVNLSDHQDYFRQVSRKGVGRFQRFFLPWMHGPALELTLRPFNAQIGDRQLYFLAFRDQATVAAALSDWMEEVGVLQNVNYQGFSLTQVQEDQSLFPLAGNSWKNPWWTMVGDYVVLAADRTALENWIDQYAVGNALPLTEVGREMTLSESGGQFSFFLDWKQWRTGWKHVVKRNELADALSGLGQLALRIRSNGGSGEINGLWKQEPAVQNDGDLTWRLVLADDVAAGPWLNRDAQGDPLIAVQDKNNRLYLLNGAGKILWQQQLGSRILSAVETIELREQLALTFNTSEAIYLLDLSGQAISPFPLKLRNPTAYAVTLVDFSQDKDYSFFVVASDGCVYGYDLQGGPVTGWNPKCQLGALQHPLLHFQDQNKDFLILRNNNGTVRAFARDGSLRLEADFPASEKASAPQVQLLGGQKQIVSCSDSGLVEVLGLEGEVIQFRLPVGNNLGVDMIYEDFSGDDRKDYLLASGRSLSLHAYTSKGLEKLFEQKFPQPVDQLFAIDLPGNDVPYIGLLFRGTQRIYILDSKGNSLKGFPLAGSTPFFIADLFHTGERHLVVGYQDELLTYRLAD